MCRQIYRGRKDLEVTKSWGDGDSGAYCLMFLEFLFGVMEKMDSSDGCTI